MKFDLLIFSGILIWVIDRLGFAHRRYVPNYGREILPVAQEPSV